MGGGLRVYNNIHDSKDGIHAFDVTKSIREVLFSLQDVEARLVFRLEMFIRTVGIFKRTTE